MAIKKLLLITSEKIGDTGGLSFSYIFQDETLQASDKFPEQCFGPFGMIKKTDSDGVYYMRVFEGGDGLLFAAPLDVNDKERNEKIVNETFPDAFSMLCTKEVADAITPVISELVELTILFSEETL